MIRCSACGQEIGQDARSCAACGSPVRAATGAEAETEERIPAVPETVALPPRRVPIARELERGPGPMLPGTVVAGRYRIVALVGRGGMGEVYRADDLKLGQAVALKFLLPGIEHDRDLLARLLDEVRIARQIAHPHVCRVHDVGEAGGRHFLSMEFIDGEDLATLLRRIGRLPPEKAVQIARQLCAGLAAAHAQGVLHRDLKPANVMLDGRGRARLMDFGLAGLEREITGPDIASGTPAYMAPEQRDGREVTVRSDVYALGLVLFELFTGRPAFESQELATLRRERQAGVEATPASHLADLAPAVEATILRCLEPDPSLRPSSPLAVAAALPGGDPLAASLAAGETPSPEVVAASPSAEGPGPWLTSLALAGALAAWTLAAVIGGIGARRFPMERAPEALADRSRDLLASVGLQARPVDRAWGYAYDEDLLRRLDADPAADLLDAVRAGRAPVVRFWYRENADAPLVPALGARVDAGDPALAGPGESLVELGPDGRLLALRVVPRPVSPELPAAAGKRPDWGRLFAAAGLDPAELEAVAPTALPPDFADARAAWRSPRSAPATGRVRVEAAGLGGQPVSFRVNSEALPPASSPRLAPRETVFFALLSVLFLGVLFAAVVQARRNLHSGRGDRRGATRLVAVVLAARLLAWLVSASHVPGLDELDLFLREVAWSTFAAAIVWVLYVALEPLLRRRAPRSLVSWMRLMAGRIQDPLVGRDLLLGSLCGGVQLSLMLSSAWLRGDALADLRPPAGVANLIGLPGLMSAASAALLTAFIQGMGFLVLLQLFSLLLRSARGGTAALFALVLFGLTVRNGTGWVTLGLVAQASLMVLVFSRLGLLAAVVMLWAFHLAIFFPLQYHPSAWYFAHSALAFALAVLPAAWGAWVILARAAPPPASAASGRR